MTSNVFTSVQKALAWFLDGLTEAVSDLTDRLEQAHAATAGRRRRRRLCDREQPDGKRERLGEDRAHRRQGALAARWKLPQLADRDVDLVLPPDELLVRTLDPLPAESRQYLDGIVRHQLERFVPWRSDNVLYAYNVAPAGPGDERSWCTLQRRRECCTRR